VGSVVPYEESHRAVILGNLREVDERELYMLTRLSPPSAFDMTASGAVRMWSGFEGGELICVFGINRRTPLSTVGVPWLIGTNAIERHYRTFGKHSIKYARLFEQAFPQMENFVLAENHITARWLKWLGFDMGEPTPMGFSNAPFIRFTKGF